MAGAAGPPRVYRSDCLLQRCALLPKRPTRRSQSPHFVQKLYYKPERLSVSVSYISQGKAAMRWNQKIGGALQTFGLDTDLLSPLASI